MRNKTILIFNPPGKLFLRCEDRCQADVEGSAATSLRAPNDLAVMASLLRTLEFSPIIKDYPAEKQSEKDFCDDLVKFKPSILIMSITTSTFKEDLSFFKKAKEICPDVVTIAKGAFFFSCPIAVLNQLKEAHHVMDCALCGETETILPVLMIAMCEGLSFETVSGIIYFDVMRKQFQKTKAAPQCENLDEIPFPARDLLHNNLYVRPDNGKPMATITTSRGCTQECIYCLAPVLSGRRLKKRSPQNIVDEVNECVSRYHIKNFFFQADTFTFDKDWVLEICKEIIKRNLTIEWVTNSRVKPLDEEMLTWMKRAGCWLISLGIESGNEESLLKMKKNTTTTDALKAVAMIHKAGLKIYGFYLIGLPWENHEHIQKTLAFAKILKCDFTEIHIAAAFQGTALYAMLPEYGLELKEPFGYNYFSNPVLGTKYVSCEELIQYRKKGLRDLYLNSDYIFRALLSIRSFEEMKNYIRYGMRLMRAIR
jgi:anaerobic magnesium-protoporphyrin IX monomethyl ester cyclase